METSLERNADAQSSITHTKDGLCIRRVFSKEDEKPFDSVEWERRDATIKNPKGEIVFEQKEVEFPKDWSALATNIVTSKYFYGDPANSYLEAEDGGREYSLRQLIYRVTTTITEWGYKQGYFASKEDSDRFVDELTWLCLHQYGAFNSPVWFNLGLHNCYGTTESGDRKVWAWGKEKSKMVEVDPYEYPQGSACFIVSIDDSIDDIWGLMSESARLFKFGSGVGSDWSTLRSTKEKLSGGGTPSGPVSFMRVQDVTGGTIKSGGKTRRAAIMQTLKVWHPDILEFVDAKKLEEQKAWALIEQGYDGSFNGPAYGSVAFQNTNQSVRVTDEFMQAVEMGDMYGLQKVTKRNEVIEEIDATMVLDRISEGTHVCGDPGMQYEDTIQQWHTCKNSGPINSSNPCSEYMFLDNSACNLASLNLRKFQKKDGSFDVERYRAATRIFITAMDIIVDNAGYPSEAIAYNSHTYRPLGLGFANLGALLMSMGLPYDSNKGRGVAGALMSILHSEAYATSAEIASNEDIGPFKYYYENRHSMMDVIWKHYNSVADIDEECPAYLREAAEVSSENMATMGRDNGFRNSQVTVLAPTGTISFMMDCDTTGIEPDIALVKYKLLAGKGDGTIKMINGTVSEALYNLGYMTGQISVILEHIEKNDTIEGCPVLDPKHLPVFDCAFKPFKGKRSVAPFGHISMMAACQPFVSGAISKTVNMPEEATVADIGKAYIDGWKLGLKALAIYRENSKRSQPLSTTKGGNTKNVSVPKAEQDTKIIYKPVRKRLPDERPSITHKFSVNGHEGYLHVGLYSDTDMPGEIFIRMSKEGSTISGLMDAFATSISIALQYGVPLEDLCSKFRFTRFEPSGLTNNPKIPTAGSLMDYIFRYLAMTFIKDEYPEEEIGTTTISDSLNKPTLVAEAHQNQLDAPLCIYCGSITTRSGACYVCTHCGSSNGCG